MTWLVPRRHLPAPETPAAPAAPARRRDRLVLVGVVVVALLALGAGLGLALGTGGRPAARPAASRSSASGGTSGTVRPPAAGTGGGAAADATLPPLGIYAGPGAAATAEAVDQELGGKVSYALDFLSGQTWTTLTNPTWLASSWSGSPFDLVIAVPMLPASGATLAQGAQGDYDGEFSLLAQRLVAGGLENAVLMVGWQPDDDGRSWYVATPAEASQYVAYWDDIESTMSAVPGAKFEFEWDPGDSGTSPVSPAAMYPGDAAVTVVGTDAFDLVPRSVAQDQQWTDVLDRPYGPGWAAGFADAHGKQLALAMWGTVPTADGGGGDAPGYVEKALRWAAGAHAAMSVLWDYGTWAVTGGHFPAADAQLQAQARSSADAPAAGAGS